MLSRTRVGLAVVMLAAALITTSSQAAADPSVSILDANCTLQNDVYTFSPPLDLTATSTTWTGSSINPGTCAITIPPPGGSPVAYSVLVSATSTGSASISCTFSGNVDGTLKVKWIKADGSNYFSGGGPNASTSTLDVNSFAVTQATKVILFQGTVTAGPAQFNGKPFTLTYDSTANTTLCATAMGLQKAPGPGTLLIGT